MISDDALVKVQRIEAQSGIVGNSHNNHLTGPRDRLRNLGDNVGLRSHKKDQGRSKHRLAQSALLSCKVSRNRGRSVFTYHVTDSD